ncbi:MAG TPA: hypothetical protein VKW78_17450 [Terriglobales bacterium]|jgi:hypothetical protein|nr:hypothetical protein [Terriglobales bacterium]
MRPSELILKQRLEALHELQASAMDLLLSGSLAKDEMSDILDMVQQLQVEAVQVEYALNRAHRRSLTTN